MASSQWLQQRRLKGENNSLQALKNKFQVKLRTDKAFVKQAVCEKTDGLTPLIRACKRGYLKVVCYLVTVCGANVHQVADSSAFFYDMQGASPLLCAVFAGHQGIVEFLILAGADVNSTSHATWTPLKAATYLGHPHIVQVLLDEGAHIELALFHGPRCAVTNWTNKHKQIRKIIEGVSISTIADLLPIKMFILFSVETMTADDRTFGGSLIVGILKWMINQYEGEGVLCDFQMIVRYTGILLQYCVSAVEKYSQHFLDIYEVPLALLDLILYLKHKVPKELDSIDYQKYYHKIIALERKRKGLKTTLHSACLFLGQLSSLEDFVHFLVAMGADVNSQDQAGNTPLHLAATIKPFMPQLVDALLQNDAHVDMVNADNKTAMELLQAQGASVCGLSRLLRYQTLQCLAARAVCKYDVPYRQQGMITEQCIEIIEQHKWTG